MTHSFVFCLLRLLEGLHFCKKQLGLLVISVGIPVHRKGSVMKSLLLSVLLLGFSISLYSAEPSGNYRKPTGEKELRYWLENMIWYHGYSEKEVSNATGLSITEIEKAQKKWNISSETKPKRSKDAPLLTLPYPGGRHPRIGFLEGAIEPQRETKISVFAPWDDSAYVVVDLPEAIWSNLGLTYLAHTHVDTIWSKQGIKMKRLEWKRLKNGELTIERKLPNGIVFGARVIPEKEAVKMELWLHNGTSATLSDLRIQNCVMLKGMPGFDELSNEKKLMQKPFVAAHSEDKKRWVITSWSHTHRAWANQKCPCLHADPKFPDIKPAQTYRIRGWLSFYEGEDIQSEFKRIQKLGWVVE